MTLDPYEVLGVDYNASSKEIKAAYRSLVKKHHPDTGGDATTILQLNAAWAVLGDQEQRQTYDQQKNNDFHFVQEANKRAVRNAYAYSAAKAVHVEVKEAEGALTNWLKTVYSPSDRLLGEVINPFPAKLRELSADPYDETLMNAFCLYLEESQKRIQKVEKCFSSQATPKVANNLGIGLYHCLSQVKDGLIELERYTMGYVDNYLHDGKEMLREAKKNRKKLQLERRRLIS